MEVDMKLVRCKTIAVSFMLISLFTISCTAREKGDDSPVSITDSANSFGLRLYNTLASENREKNIFTSPLSISIALAMTYNGASGKTAAEMADVLEFDGLDRDEINTSIKQLMAELEGDVADVRLDIANSLWARDGLAFKKPFIERARRHYGAEVRTLDFKSPRAKGIINGWISDKTQGMIDELIDTIPEDAILYLINAIYFKGQWENEFDPALTREEDFHISAERTKKVAMMRRSEKYDYFECEDFQAVNLPYGDGRISMLLFLPARDSGLERFHAALDADNWEMWMGSFGRRRGTVALPRFKARFKTTLNDPLEQLGMARAFDPDGAEFPEMIEVPSDNVSISRVLHEAMIDVNEEGTEAAAATAVEMKLTSARMEVEPFTMICDRPFFLAIRDEETGVILFLGSIVDPE
jgi:serpin B